MKMVLILLFIGMTFVRGAKVCPECKTIAEGPWNGTYYLKNNYSSECNDVDHRVDTCLYTKDGTNYCFKRGRYPIKTICPDSGKVTTDSGVNTTESGGNPCTTCLKMEGCVCHDDCKHMDMGCHLCVMSNCRPCEAACGVPA